MGLVLEAAGKLSVPFVLFLVIALRYFQILKELEYVSFNDLTGRG